jgi:hypothetical protein
LLSEGQSGLVYNSHDGKGGLTAQADTKELSICLPSLGNTISEVWDIVYGGENLATEQSGQKIRNLNLNWEDASIVQERSGVRLV